MKRGKREEAPTDSAVVVSTKKSNAALSDVMLNIKEDYNNICQQLGIVGSERNSGWVLVETFIGETSAEVCSALCQLRIAFYV